MKRKNRYIIKLEGKIYEIKCFQYYGMQNSRIAFSLEHPTVGSDPLKFGESVVGTGVEVDEEQHVQHSADDPHSMWWRQHGVKAIEKLPKSLNLCEDQWELKGGGYIQ